MPVRSKQANQPDECSQTLEKPYEQMFHIVAHGLMAVRVNKDALLLEMPKIDDGVHEYGVGTPKHQAQLDMGGEYTIQLQRDGDPGKCHDYRATLPYCTTDTKFRYLSISLPRPNAFIPLGLVSKSGKDFLLRGGEAPSALNPNCFALTNVFSYKLKQDKPVAVLNKNGDSVWTQIDEGHLHIWGEPADLKPHPGHACLEIQALNQMLGVSPALTFGGNDLIGTFPESWNGISAAELKHHSGKPGSRGVRFTSCFSVYVGV